LAEAILLEDELLELLEPPELTPVLTVVVVLLVGVLVLVELPEDWELLLPAAPLVPPLPAWALPPLLVPLVD